jgi:hypothetical protein
MSHHYTTCLAVKYLKERGLIYTEDTFCTWRCLGKGPRYIKLANKVFYRQEDLDNFINSAKVTDTVNSHKEMQNETD